MIKQKVVDALNKQIELEQYSSQLYLAMASWSETNGYESSAKFLYMHSDEERMHMLKFFHYINDRGAQAIVPESKKPKCDYESVQSIYAEILEHEFTVSSAINELVGVCAEEHDFTTQNFLQWFVTEQIEEESLFRNILDKLNLLGNDKASLFLFEKEIEAIMAAKAKAV